MRQYKPRKFKKGCKSADGTKILIKKDRTRKSMFSLCCSITPAPVEGAAAAEWPNCNVGET